jgi:hypothetical protein
MASEELFKTAPKEVIDYFDRRPSVPTFDWRDLAAREHALAHTVAKTAGFNVLEDLREAVRKAVVDRIPFDQFRDELIPLLKKRGWWGEKRAYDEEAKRHVKAQLGSIRRLQTIYWANVHSAHAAGEWARVQQNREFLPWLTYVSSVSERKRPLHLSWVGVTLPVSDSWWRSHYPPNGWNCKCSVRQIGDREASRLHQAHGKDKAPPLDERGWLNKRTGGTERIPAGIDPGWQNNPGITRAESLSNVLVNSIARMPDADRKVAIEGIMKSPLMDAVQGNAVGYDPKLRYRAEMRDIGRINIPVGELPAPLADALGSRTPFIRFSARGGEKQLRRRKGDPLTKEDYAKVSTVVATADRIMIDGRHLDAIAVIDGEDWVVGLTVIDGVTWLDTLFRPRGAYAARMRAGERQRDIRGD